MISLEKVVSITIEELDLSIRTYNCLKRAGLDTVGKLCEVSEDKLCAVRNIGRKGIEEVKRNLWGLGLSLKDGVYYPTSVKNEPEVDLKQNSTSDNSNYDSFCTMHNCEFRKVCSLEKSCCAKEYLNLILRTLTPKQEELIKLYYGIDSKKEKTYVEIGEALSITSEQVIQIRAKTLRKLRHPSRSDWIKVILPTILATKETPYSKLVKSIFGLKGSNAKLFKTEVLYPLQKKLY